MSSYTIPSKFKPLEVFNTQVLQERNPQPSSKMAQIQNKARMTHKGALKNMQLIASVLYVINEVELSILGF